MTWLGLDDAAVQRQRQPQIAVPVIRFGLLKPPRYRRHEIPPSN
jgi:hypothetical protein